MRDDLIAPRVSSTPSLRMLIVAPYDVLPAWHGGQIRIIKLARELARGGHDVTLVTPWQRKQTPKLHRDEPFRLRQMCYPFLQRGFSDRPFPFFHLMSFHPGLRHVTRSMLRDFQVVQFEHVSFAGLLREIPESTVVGYDAHNVEYDYVRQECRGDAIAGIVGRRIHRLERSLVERSDRVFPVSSLDQERLASLYGLEAGKWRLAPNGIDMARAASEDDTAMIRRFPALDRFRTRAILSGSNADHNRRATSFLLEKLAPATPDVGYVVHGTCGVPFERNCTLANVFFDADIDRRTFVDYAVRGTIGLNAVETGGGTNLKLLHYLSHGLPVLSTAFGMRGYDDLTSFVRVERRDDFAAALSDGGFPVPPPPSLLMDRYSWRMVAGRVADAYRERLAESG